MTKPERPALPETWEYEETDPSLLPHGGLLAWDTPPQHQGQIIEVSYASGGFSRVPACDGAPFKRIRDHSLPDGARRVRASSDAAYTYFIRRTPKLEISQRWLAYTSPGIHEGTEGVIVGLDARTVTYEMTTLTGHREVLKLSRATFRGLFDTYNGVRP